MENHIPKKKSNPKERHKLVWIDKKTMRKIKKKYNLYKRFLGSKSGQDYLNYKQERNECKKAIKRAKREYEKKIAKDCKSNPKIFWKYVQEKLKTNTGISTLRDQFGSIASTDSQKATLLNTFFASVFTNEDKTNIPEIEKNSRSKGASLTEIRVTPAAVEKKLKGLDPSKAQGPDNLPGRVLKELALELSGPLCLLFNKTLETGEIPEDWKRANVIAIFKKGAKSSPGNYRPVSLTCILCKILESMVRDAIVSFFTDNKLYSNCQHGFRKKRSCMTQLLEVMDDFTQLMDDNVPFDILYLDFRKAFDSVPHERLLVKLASYGIDGSVLKWVRGFLSSRTQKVRVGVEHSTEEMVSSGIPQGSILGPILFTIFINDLPNYVQSTCKIFADDTKLYEKSVNHDKLQDDLTALQNWSLKWNLYFNSEKCKVLHAGKQNPEHVYYMGDATEVMKCKEEKDLGVTFDSKLSFDPHIQNCINKANKMLGIIKRSFDYLDRDIFIKLYKALIRPHLEYGNLIWYPYLKRQSISIEKVQRRATKTLHECKDLSYHERLRYLNMPTLKHRRRRGDLIEMYKIFNQVDEVSLKQTFTVNNTRNNEGKLYVNHSNMNIRKFSFANRVVNDWNNTTNTMKFANNTNSFKNLLDGNKIFNNSFYEYDE